jgi:hypothetical protein
VFRKKKFGGFIVEGVPLKEEKNLGAQIAMALLVGVVFCLPWVGAAVAVVYGWHLSVAAIGLIVAIDVVLLIGIALWTVRRWSY